MNIERVINMILRRLVGRAVNAGVNAGIKAVSKRGKGQGADKDTRPVHQDEATAQKARLMRRNTRPPRF
ncbi:hypothetical protein [Phaeobacter piscinae]|uniref:hypothetical protein n=1 Tax=Phaeobacter piscinae TaxID=1580596 RepID=UPI000C9C2E5C|nr:hypothetical protein [Phaeobacter piscinae]AUQ74856.1 hypothetical protein PhaeoP71_01997 [Phaeobacter piscinae]